MNYDALLTYISEVPNGRWEQFKQALDALQDPTQSQHPVVVARSISVLGHAEFVWEPQLLWSTCPAALVHLPRREQPTAVLCGQRTESLCERLRQTVTLEDARYDERAQPDGPAVLRVIARSTDALQAIADQLGIALVYDAAESLTGCLPTLAALTEASPRCLIPAIPPIEVFDTKRHVWVPVDQVTGDGVYRYENFAPDFRLIHQGVCRKVLGEVGIYAVLDGACWEYDHEEHTLSVPYGLLPPALYQRALVLCSGFLASRHHASRRWIFGDVPPALAHFLAQKLGQTLEVQC